MARASRMTPRKDALLGLIMIMGFPLIRGGPVKLQQQELLKV